MAASPARVLGVVLRPAVPVAAGVVIYLSPD
jgi:hypothetical protein